VTMGASVNGKPLVSKTRTGGSSPSAPGFWCMVSSSFRRQAILRRDRRYLIEAAKFNGYQSN
jgi:hypothetical protein